MRLWTIQEEEAWKAFQHCGILRADEQFIDPDLLHAYDWMRQQRQKRIPWYTGRYPVWAWYCPKPGLRYAAYLPPKTRAVRIECNIPTEKVLLSDFETWHYVLSGWYLPLTKKEEGESEAQLPPTNPNPPYHKLPIKYRKQMEKSWERVFDFGALDSAQPLHGPVTHIQAVLEELSIKEITRVQPFIAR